MTMPDTPSKEQIQAMLAELEGKMESLKNDNPAEYVRLLGELESSLTELNTQLSEVLES